MSSSDRLNPQQLRMFMPARELIELPFHEPDREMIYHDEGEDEEGYAYENDDQFWDRKLEESYLHDFDNLAQDIEASGKVTMPVKLTVDKDLFPRSDYGLRIRQGHHRIASAFGIDPDMEVPVRHIVDDGGRWIGNAPRRNE